ncbi:Erythroid differentiation-related factor 1-like Protein [Tribolium castaneum]|uniref:Erythroid differentiation-related factor 1-like Protein n=1 Tax=Tribolium castaneum TaxID=7070 RepID=D6WC98_TRICA|nr:PREDICTED: erythroid differentiation-related factor 1 [Tribolium castaneum]XP_015832919.1 PREDICTED: erythroid differentiation-related factor 1 [Tribolium castaneum]EEZ97828.2 Erythroid differentiation-related factor 1-like Protein [Tribolium castaneum]|eukprot:XP_008190459.1 PREDICTED: erythroid differentiation-related factor 1 [Tribolium castaneum]
MENEDSETADSEEVKSRAVVKYSVPKPAQFIRLKCNTDLNLPPSNWLSSSADSYGLQHVLYHQKGFSSFRMAHMFPDCVGEVDVVSDAENIKNLLKIPYCKNHISMMVHRVENTLLLDDFDIYKHLLRTSETEWKWLKEFFFENVNHETYEEDKNMYIKNRRRETLQQKSLVSKFLYHSLAEGDTNENTGYEDPKTLPVPLHGPQLPEPVSATPDPKPFDHNYNRNVVWTFEDIEMLIGTDLPIFGGGTHPCISLRLRDVSKPINVLTGIDYWLDNLMSNVPEVVMCYHLNGIVQKYELIKTEDLPRLDNSKFSPKLIRDVAQSILSFLKSNATKAGHTYWLFKGKDEEVVKLYDLTSLCSEKDVENGQNPFTIPVGMLLYRVARNMKHTSDRQPGTIRMLLKNCVKLLPEEKYPEVVTSSHYMLADLYVPAGTNPEAPGLEQEVDENDEFDDDDLIDDKDDKATKILVLDQSDSREKFVNYYKSPPPITGTVEERCLQAVQHVATGLNCLQYFQQHQTSASGKKTAEEEEVPVAKPFEPIPMPYAKLDSNDGQKKQKKKDKKKKNEKKSENALLLKNNTQPLPTWQNGTGNISWKDHLKTLLYEKAVLVYAILSEQHFGGRNYGNSLRTIGLLARCQLVMNRLLYNSNALKENCLLGRAGDCCIMMIQNWDKVDSYRQQFQNNSEEDLKLMEQLEKDEQLYNIHIGESNMKCVFIYDIRTIEQILLKGVECYEVALKSSENDSILRRLGNGLNEVASFYLNKAKSAKTSDLTVEMCKKAEPYLTRGLIVFEKVKDEANVALLYTNMGHMHRLLAHANTPENRGELSQKEKLHYNKAFINYKKALQVLGDRKHCPGIWDAVRWELSTAFFNMGTIMHENPPSNISKAEAEKEVIEVLQKALLYCDFDEANPKYPLYQYRAAMIHYRIGCLYHSHIWTAESDSTNRKNIIQLAKINYEKASKYYLLASDAISYFTSQMQRVALFEYLGDTANAPNIKIKHLQYCLSVFIEINDMVKLVVEKKVEVPEDADGEKEGFKSCYALLNLIKQRLQHVLKMLVKLCLTKPPVNKDCPKLGEVYKSCYMVTFDLKDGVTRDEFVEKLHIVLTQICDKIAEFNKTLD